MRIRRRLLIGCASVLFAYVVSYIVLTIQGRYEPAVTNAGHVMWYDWAPRGFVRGDHWNTRLMYFYAPLYLLDWHLWHEPQRWISSGAPAQSPS
jgi:hypothetical protein